MPIHPPKMNFQLGVTNSEFPPLGIGTRRQDTDYGMSIQHSMQALNHPASSLHFLNQSGHGGSEVETLINFPRPEISEIDDLSAVVTQCTNPNVFLNLYTPPSFIPTSGCGSVNSIADVFSQDRIDRYSQGCIDRDNDKTRAHCMHHKVDAKAAQPMLRFPPSEPRGVEDAENLKYKHLKKKRCRGPETNAGVSGREFHILSERKRRSGMNQLLSKMRSLLPDQTAKSDKISIVTETINYIDYLRQRIGIYSKKCASIGLPEQGAGGADTAGSPQSHRTGPSSADTMILPEISVKSHAGKDLYITIKCEKKGNLLPSILLVVEGQNLEVMDAFVSTNDTVAFHCLHLKALHTLDAAGRKDLTDTLLMLTKSGFQISLDKRD